MNVYKNDEDFWRNPEDRRNVWDFSYYAITVLYYILSDYFSVIKIPEEETKYKLLPQILNDDYNNLSEKKVRNLLGSLKQYRNFFESEDDMTDDEERVFAEKLVWNLHKIISLLPWLNMYNFSFVKGLSDDITLQSGFSFQELLFPNKIIADKILPVLRSFTEVSINNPGFFYRCYTSNERGRQWDWIMSKMVTAFEWLSTNYKCTGNNEIPDEIVFGFHAFAEFLIEMNQP
uniref:Uncharacterized protein n=1 Tax=uncultured Muribaculaceae bacterium TaxID=2301481 RepID=A0A6G8F3I6_9BACT|nr:hypothetical protein Muribac1_0220 [uncultured Muribaculaceae bacterium]